MFCLELTPGLERAFPAAKGYGPAGLKHKNCGI